jgi:hypothetical protein
VSSAIWWHDVLSPLRATTAFLHNGYSRPKDIGGFIARRHATGPRQGGVFVAVIKIPAMKNDLSFKILSAVIIAGVIVALVSPGQPAGSTKNGVSATIIQTAARP